MKIKFINRWIILVILVLALGATFYYSYNYIQQDESQRVQYLIFTITTSLTAGLIIALIQFLLEWKRHYESEQLHRLGVKKILNNREDEEFYKRKIEESQERLWVLGNTSSRLMVDFADERESKLEKRALIQALERGVDVRIFVTNKRYLSTKNEKKHFNITKDRFLDLKTKFPKKFNYKYYSHPPNHSIFVFDNECFVGPIFKGLKSRDTPSIYTNTNKDFAKKYLDYFEQEWNKIEDED